MNRVLAVLVAVGMVAGAIYLRGRIDDDGDNGGRGRAAGGTLVCDPELERVCRAATDDVQVEDAAATAERVLRGDPAPAAWLTPGPWADIVDALRPDQAHLYPNHGSVLASTRLALVAGNGAPTRWKALGTQVGKGDFRLGWRNPDSGIGVLQLGAFTTGWFGRDDVATNDFDATFESWLEGIDHQAEAVQDPLERRLQQGPSFAEGVVSYEAEAGPVLQGAAPGRRGDLRPLYPDPVVSVEAVLAGSGAHADDLRAALQDEGWAAPRPTNLPSPGVLAALWGRFR